EEPGGFHLTCFAERIFEDVELPVELPRYLMDWTVWVGAEGWSWSPVFVSVEAERVVLVLERGAAVRVLHDAELGEDVVVAIVSESEREPIETPVSQGTETVVTGFGSGRHSIWLERARTV